MPEQYGQEPGYGYPPPGHGYPPPETAPGTTAGVISGVISGGGPRRRRNLPALAIAAVVAIALIASGIVYVAQRSTNAAGGADSPTAAVEQLVGAVNDADPMAIADQLDPAEARLIGDTSSQIFGQLQRLGIIRDDVKPDSATGVTISLDDVTYGADPISITDDIALVEVTGGTVTVDGRGGELPFTDQVTDAFPELRKGLATGTQTHDLADATDEAGTPLRIATVERDGRWYPSVAYTIANGWATDKYGPGYQLDPVAAHGADSPAEALDALIGAAMDGDARAAIALLPPGEMGVVHDYGNLMLEGTDASSDSPGSGKPGVPDFGGMNPGGMDLGGAGITLADSEWVTSDVEGSNNATKVSLGELTLNIAGQGEVVITRDPEADSLTISAPGQPTQTFDGQNVADMISAAAGGQLGPVPPEVTGIVEREFGKILGLGVVTVQGPDDLWYLSPTRTYVDMVVSLLSGLEPGDVTYLLSLADH